MSAVDHLDIVVYGDAPFDFHLWTNRQHVASRLPALRPEVRVLYVEAPTWVADRWRGRRYATQPVEMAPVGRRLLTAGERLWVHRTEIPTPTRVAYGPAWGATRAIVQRQVRTSARAIGLERPVLWLYGPAGALLRGALDERLLCYDVVDDYANTAHVERQGDRVRDADLTLTREADLVFAASRAVADARAEINDATTFVGNAADTRLFARALEPQPRPSDLPEGGVVVYHGALRDGRFDADLVVAVADRMPDVTFALLGPADAATTSALAGSPNVALLGPRPQAELVPYLHHADAALVPHRDTPHVRSSSSLKLVELLAAGLGVVTIDLPAFAGFGDDVVRADGPDETAGALRAAMAASDPGSRRRRSAATSGSDWNDKAGRLLTLIDTALERS